MCGIAGLAQLDGERVDEGLVRAMTGAIAHRGPDAEGFHFAPGIGLGHRRLSIIDLSAAGTQPLASADGTIWVVFNGEIYNYRELRARLEARGHRFRTHTDTEVLIYLYREEGAEMVHSLRGMFAFAIWDAQQRSLLLARDRLGIKPLFYTQLGRELAFASEVKSLLRHPRLPRSIDRESLDAFLAHNYSVAPRTLLSEVRQLEPGELLEADARGVRRRRYWVPRFEPDTSKRSDADWLEELEAKLVDAVRCHLIADVPIGILLSSGVDSGTLLGLTRKVHGDEVESFTADFAEASYSEAPRARLVAETLNARNAVTLVHAPSLDDLARVVFHADEPTGDMSMLPFDKVAELARSRVKVVLSGEGADEIFAGYDTYVASIVAARYRKVPGVLRGLIRRAAARLPDSRGKVTAVEKLKRFVRGAESDPLAAHLTWRMINDPEARDRLLGGKRPGNGVPPGAEAVLADARAFGELERLLYVDQRFYLPNDMLVKADRMSMAHGLEVRVPYLDHELVELANRMPARLKLGRGFVTKRVLRQVAERVLPPVARPPRKKLGFNVPFAAWLDGPLRGAAHDLLQSPQLDELGLSRPAVAEVLRDHFTRGKNRGYELYGLMVLSLWQRHISGFATHGGVSS